MRYAIYKYDLRRMQPSVWETANIIQINAQNLLWIIILYLFISYIQIITKFTASESV